MNSQAAASNPDPDFTWNEQSGDWAACIRPCRRDTFRLEIEKAGGKSIIHNYGHGGAGITMSWGCAVEVRDLVRAHTAAKPGDPVAVVGGGVMGLTSAALLLDDGFKVTLYASAFSGTTSDKAGGQWAPSIVEFSDRPRFQRILQNAYAIHRQRIGQGFGVSERTNFCKQPAHGLGLAVSAGVLPPPKQWGLLPFAHMNSPGLSYETLLIEPPIFLPRLRADLAGHAVSKVKTFTTKRDLLKLSERVIVNCAGYGAGSMLKDPRVEPGKGLLALLPAQANLEYLFSNSSSYVFPRSDHVVVGGSFEAVANETKNPARLAIIVANAKAEFEGRAVAKSAWDLPTNK